MPHRRVSSRGSSRRAIRRMLSDQRLITEIGQLLRSFRREPVASRCMSPFACQRTTPPGHRTMIICCNLRQTAKCVEVGCCVLGAEATDDQHLTPDTWHPTQGRAHDLLEPLFVPALSASACVWCTYAARDACAAVFVRACVFAFAHSLDLDFYGPFPSTRVCTRRDW